MDPVGAAASVLTLLDAAIKTTKLINRFVHQYRDVPAEITRLKHKVSVLRSQLVLLRAVEDALGRNSFELDDVEASITLEAFVQRLIIIFSEICGHLEDHCLTDVSGKRSKLKWALLDASKIEKWECEIQQHSAELGNILMLLNLRSSTLLHSKFEDSKPILETTFLPAKVQLQDKIHLMRTLYYFGNWAIIPFIARLQGLSSKTRRGNLYTYNFSVHLQALFCLKVIYLDFKICQPSLFSLGNATFGIDLKVRTLVEEDSEVMLASKRGDTEAVWTLFQAGKASVRDVTPANRSPLRYAIESGSTDLVRYLINNGADVNEYCGFMQTNLIQCAFAFSYIEIARLLISNGTEIHHINATGWTPAFHIFGTAPNPILRSSCECIEMLSAASFNDFDTQDTEGWTCMHRAAAYGCANDIKLLVKLNVSTTIQTIKVCWTPIFCAVHFGNISTFEELRRTNPDFLALKDVRRWTLLHVAVNAKRVDMIAHLISLGADPYATSLATQFLVPVDLKGGSVTPGDIAVLRGENILNAFIAALANCGHDVEVYRDGGEVDIFWPAVEVIPDSVSTRRT
ncbi:Ankyrin repeat domain-containing protein 60 [Cadophora gregata]|uniref:Ankyrin repeat domain-containing protein 60 n=1 Tax=Cadophora gregata TaxID=51156 RepID=UPI0026DD7CE3|nr:Ankyrin repeat domain-containing protein 60 [Cadophora gregata]KAK0109536.1 Ankyrin repeat domain-containing protein 60 [Cadophora gregata]KAK0110838.1 Ankyrin repeat domain-containing protein 60 [Cadophora gregata f. sp. sojae]